AIANYYLDADDKPSLQISVGPGAVVSDADSAGLVTHLSERLNWRQNRNAPDGKANPCEVRVVLRRLNGGTELARANNVSSGQVQFVASVSVTLAGSNELLNAFTVSRTLTWESVYGASRFLQDVDFMFADDIAAALTGQSIEVDRVS